MENNIHPSPVWMLDPILSDLRWICKEVNPVAGFGYLFPMWFRGILWPQNPVLAWIYTIYCSQNYMEITPFAEFPIENLPFDKVPFLSPTNGWVWSLLVKGFSPEGSRKRYAMVKLQYASSTEGHLVGTVYFKKQIPKFSFLYTMMKTCDISIP